MPLVYLNEWRDIVFLLFVYEVLKAQNQASHYVCKMNKYLDKHSIVLLQNRTSLTLYVVGRGHTLYDPNCFHKTLVYMTDFFKEDKVGAGSLW